MRKVFSFALVLVLSQSTVGWGHGRQTTCPPSAAFQAAYSYFDRIEGHRFDEFLQRIRPGKVSPGMRDRLLSMLPQDDIVTATTEQKAKLRVIVPILRYHDRDSVIDMKVLRHDRAAAAFLPGAAILITPPALKILSAEELQAIAAHELAHEYFWTEFERARQEGQSAILQELELRCDGIAVITLIKLALNPEGVISAVRKLNRYNGYKDDAAPAERYVSTEERVKFSQEMTAMLRRVGQEPTTRQ